MGEKRMNNDSKGLMPSLRPDAAPFVPSCSHSSSSSSSNNNNNNNNSSGRNPAEQERDRRRRRSHRTEWGKPHPRAKNDNDNTNIHSTETAPSIRSSSSSSFASRRRMKNQWDSSSAPERHQPQTGVISRSQKQQQQQQQEHQPSQKTTDRQSIGEKKKKKEITYQRTIVAVEPTAVVASAVSTDSTRYGWYSSSVMDPTIPQPPLLRMRDSPTTILTPLVVVLSAKPSKPRIGVEGTAVVPSAPLPKPSDNDIKSHGENTNTKFTDVVQRFSARIIPSLSTEDNDDSNLNCNRVLHKRPPHMDKLRDRWWDLLRERAKKNSSSSTAAQQKSTAAQHNASNTEPTVELVHSQDSVSTGKSSSQVKCVAMRNTNSEVSPSTICSSINSCVARILSIGEAKADWTNALKAAIQANDEHGLVQIFQTSHRSDFAEQQDESDLSNDDHPNDGTIIMSPMQLAVLLDMPHLLRRLCHCSVGNNNNSNMATTNMVLSVICLSTAIKRMDKYTLGIPPLLMAIKLEHEECLQILLTFHGVSSFLTIRDSQGNTGFHYCCLDHCLVGSNSSASSRLNVLLAHVASSSAVLLKALSSRNSQQQTPLHMACLLGHTDFVDLLLNHRLTSNLSMLSKLLAMQDMERQTPFLAAITAGSTDIVMSLLMWRGNNHAFKQPTTNRTKTTASILTHSSSTGTDDVSCPLSWAVRLNNIDMVSLLLEFNNSTSKSVYNLVAALISAVEAATSVLSCPDDNEVDRAMSIAIIRVLVEAGANPCAADDDNPACIKSCAISLAVLRKNPLCLLVLLNSYEVYLRRIQSGRRKDPKLQNQPDIFFVGMDCIENSARNLAIREALVNALLYTCVSLPSDDAALSAFTKCCLILYQQGIRLHQCDMIRLNESLSRKKINQQRLDVAPIIGTEAEGRYHYQSIIRQQLLPRRQEPKNDNILSYSSRLMTSLPWFSSLPSRCTWLNSFDIGLLDEANTFPDPNVMLLCNDGGQFLAHETVLVQSGKLDAAIRFAKFAGGKFPGENLEWDQGRVDIEVDLTSWMCQRMLEHMYHGSFVVGLSDDGLDGCRELLDLLLLAEEFLCSSMVQECELRLLASAESFNRCFCYNCSMCPGPTEDHRGTIEWTCHVSGPSYLVTALSSVEVLSVVQYLNEVCCISDYSVLCKTFPFPSKNYIARPPLESLLRVTLNVVVCDFGLIITNEMLLSTLHGSRSKEKPQDEALERLLQMSLEELCSIDSKRTDQALEWNKVTNTHLKIDR